MSTAANTSTETHEIEKGIFLTIKAMNQQTADGDPVTVHIFTVSPPFSTTTLTLSSFSANFLNYS